MPSKVDLCNLALRRIGSSKINAFDDNTVEARDCDAVYELLARQVMALGPWPSVIRRAALAQLDETPAYEYSYTYQLPTSPECLRVISVNESKRGEVNYTIEGKKLLIDDSSVSIRYLAYLEESADYDIYLEQAIVDRLASELAYNKTGQFSVYKSSLDYANSHAKELLAMAGMQGVAEDINSDTFIDARNDNWPNEGRLRD